MQQHSDLPIDDGRGLVVFLRGLWMHPNSWSPWQKHFDGSGYDSVIATEPSENDGLAGSFGHRIRVPPVSFTDSLDSTAAMLTNLRPNPILIGHGMGAVTAQVLLGHRSAATAAIAVAPPATGWISKSALLGHLRTRISLGSTPTTAAGRLTLPAFASGYANTLDTREVSELYERHVVSSSTRAVLQAARTWREPGGTPVGLRRPPLLLISGGKDRLCPESGTRAWERFGRNRYPNDVTDHHVFPAAGHSMVIDAGWEDVANFCLDWLTSQNL